MRLQLSLQRLTCLSASVFFFFSSVLGQTFPLSENTWDNPEFVDRFLGSYGFDTKLEPQITQTESEQLQALVPLIDSSLDAAIASLRESLTPETNAALIYTLGNLYMEKQDFREAVVQYKAAIKKFPNFRRAYRNASLALIQEQSFKEAQVYLLKAIELGDNSSMAYGLLGYCYLNQDLFDSALEAYRIASLLDPSNKDWKTGKVQALLETENYENAITSLREIIKERPDAQSALWISLSNAYLELGSPEQAANYLEILRRMGKANTASLTLLGDIYVSQDLPKLALTAYTEALKISGEDRADSMLKLAKTLSSRAAYDEAMMYLVTFKEKYDDSSNDAYPRNDVLNLEAEIAFGLGEDDLAARILTQITELDPLNPRANRLLSDYYYVQKDFVQAKFYLERLASLSSYRAEALVQMARIEVAQSNFAEAVVHLEEAQVLDPKPNVARYLEAVKRAVEASR